MNQNSSGTLKKAGVIDNLAPSGLLGGWRTIAMVLNENRGAGPGFDALRIGLALSILSFHSVQNSYASRYVEYIPASFHPLILALLPMFFCLSGFLVTGSAVRTRSVMIFLTYRGLRIFPALAVEVTLSAILLGPFMTNLPLSQYFTDHQFYAYFGNIISMIRYTLPGVFTDNPVPDIVNVSLWTLRPEFYCYLVMAGLIVSGVIYNRVVYTWMFVIATVTLEVVNLTTGFGDPTTTCPWQVILYYFFVGILAFHWRDRIPVNFYLFALAAVISYFLLPLHGWVFIVPIPLTYCIVYLGMLKIPRIPLLQNGDYSYGIYLFHFPIQQSLVHLFPWIREWWLLLPAAATLAILCAAGSWHFIEKPSLRLKKRLFPTPSPSPQTAPAVG